MLPVRIIVCGLVIFQLLLISACRNKEGEKALLSAVDIASSGVESLDVRPAFGGTILESGTQTPFLAIGIRSDSSELDVTDRVSWSSSDSSIMTVNGSGVVTALNLDGSAQLQANWGGLTGNLGLSVSSAPLVSIAFDGFPSSISECFSGTQLGVLGNYTDRTSDITHLVTTWQSADTSLATVGQRGMVDTLNAGSVQVSAQYGGQSTSQTLTILDDLQSLAISPAADFSLETGSTVTFEASATDANGSRGVNSVAEFSSQSANVLSISGSTAAAVAVGSSVVSAMCGGLTSNSVTVTVTEPKTISALVIRYNGSTSNPAGPFDVSDGPIQLRAFLVYNDNSELDVTVSTDLSWSVSRTISGTPATVDNDGSGKGEVDFNSTGRNEITAAYETDDDYFEATLDILVD